MVRLYSYCIALFGFLACYCQAAAIMNNSTDDESDTLVPPKVYVIDRGSWHCTKHRSMSDSDKADVKIALEQHYSRGQWGQECYSNGWCVDTRNLISWNSPIDCMNELRGYLYDCAKQGAGDGYIEQYVGAAMCMMHYWCDGC